MEETQFALALEHQLAGLVGYLLGSIPFGLVLTKMFGAGDLRSIGSGNIGATNVLRTGRKGLALATLLLDSGKGAAAALLFGWLWGMDYALAAGLFAVIGHNFPIWLQFKGGKGVATTLGTILAWSPLAGLACCLTWLVVAALFRFSSLAALAALTLAPVYLFFLSTPNAAVISIILTILSFARHHENIRRLREGTESKIKLGKSGPDSGA
ncbi:MAG: glycerol-3-phosphate 1-O-acyltransferase PlsY [Magnetovibrionaceae bacterium]